MRRHKIWLGLGSVVLAASPAALPAMTFPAAASAAEAAVRYAQAGEAGEAGEGGSHSAKGHSAQAGEGGEGEGVVAKLPPDQRLFVGLSLIRGHLMVGDELVAAGRWADALPHFVHPQEEIYGGIQNDLKARKIAPFLANLKSLAQTVKAKNAEAYAQARARVEKSLDSAQAAVHAHEADWAKFVLEGVLRTLQAAAEEYEAAIKDGKIVNVVEYQDSRGFVREADRAFESVAADLAAKNPEAVKEIRGALSDLKGAWPSVQPPEKPVKAIGAVLADLSRIELQLSSLR